MRLLKKTMALFVAGILMLLNADTRVYANEVNNDIEELFEEINNTETIPVEDAEEDTEAIMPTEVETEFVDDTESSKQPEMLDKHQEENAFEESESKEISETIEDIETTEEKGADEEIEVEIGESLSSLEVGAESQGSTEKKQIEVNDAAIPYLLTVGSYQIEFRFTMSQEQLKSYGGAGAFVMYLSENQDEVDSVITIPTAYARDKHFYHLSLRNNGSTFYYAKVSGYLSGSALKPETTYYYRILTRAKSGDKLITPSTMSFTTGEAVSGSEVSIGNNLTVEEIGYSYVELGYTISNPKNEDIISSSVEIKSGKLVDYGLDTQIDDCQYTSLVLPGKQTVSAQGEVTTRVGASGSIQAVTKQTETISGIKAKDLTADNITVAASYSYEESDGVLTVNVAISPFFSKDDGMELLISDISPSVDTNVGEYIYERTDNFNGDFFSPIYDNTGTILQGVASVQLDLSETNPVTAGYYLTILAPYYMMIEDTDIDDAPTDVAIWRSGRRTIQRGKEDHYVEAVSIDKRSLELNVGECDTLSAFATDERGEFYKGAKIKWRSTDEGVAIVDQNGVVSAVGAGEAAIIASCGLGADDCPILVTSVPQAPQNVRLVTENLTLFEEDVTKIQALVTPKLTEENDGLSVVWKSSQPEILSVTPKEGNLLEAVLDAGKVDHDQNVTVTVSATAGENVTKSASCIVTVRKADITAAEVPDGKENTVWARLAETDAYAYTGKSIKPAIEVYDGRNRLTEKTDYTLTIPNAVNQGSYKAKITMKGNYSKTVIELPFTIERRSIEEAGFAAENLTLAASTKAIKVNPVLTWNGKKLRAGTDFTFTPKEVSRTGEKTVALTGAGNFTGTRELKVKIADGSANEVLLTNTKLKPGIYLSGGTAPVTRIAWSDKPVGEREDVTVELKYAGETVPSAAYTFSQNSLEAGKAKLTITGTGIPVTVGSETLSFFGTKELSFTITGESLASVAELRDGWLQNLAYSSVAAATEEGIIQTGDVSQALVLKAGKTVNSGALSDKYTVSYKNNKKAGNATIIFTGRNGYTGTITKGFKIVSDFSGNALTIEDPGSVTFEKGGVKPSLVVRDSEDRILKEKTDYTVKFSGNQKVGACTATVTGKGNYAKLTAKVTFQVVQRNIDELTVTVPDVVYNKTVGRYLSTVTVTDINGKKLTAGKDYKKLTKADYSFGGNAAPPIGSSISVIITGFGNYTGTAERTYRIIDSAKQLSKATFQVKNQSYIGKAILIDEQSDFEKAFMKLKSGEATMVYGKDFEVIGYQNNQNTGTAKVILHGLGSYGGTKTVSFKIVPK